MYISTAIRKFYKNCENAPKINWGQSLYRVSFNVSFIPFFVFGFWSLLVTKLRKYKYFTKSLFTFCKARRARRKKTQENQATKVTKIPKTKTQKYGMNESLEAEKMDLFYAQIY